MLKTELDSLSKREKVQITSIGNERGIIIKDAQKITREYY